MKGAIAEDQGYHHARPTVAMCLRIIASLTGARRDSMSGSQSCWDRTGHTVYDDRLRRLDVKHGREMLQQKFTCQSPTDHTADKHPGDSPCTESADVHPSAGAPV